MAKKGTRAAYAAPRVRPRPLVVATVLYLAAPVAVFFAGWLRSPWREAALAGLAWASWATVRGLGGAGGGGGIDGRRRRVLGFLGGTALLALVVSLLGAGGAGIPTWDWQKHNAVLADLVAQGWPVAYRLDPPAGDLALVYYVAYYLPAALVGRAAGWAAAHAALFAWTVLGVVLAWRWLTRLGRAPAAVALAVVVLFTGFELAGALLGSTRLGPQPWWQQFDLEWWQGRFVYPGNVTLIAYAPHQALGGWLATALCLEALRRGRRRFPFAAPGALCLLWSPFCALGLAALAALVPLAGGTAGAGRRLARWGRGQLSLASLAAVVGVALPVVLYFAARLPPPALPADLLPPDWARRHAALAFLPAALGISRFLAEWGRFLAVELLPLVAALFAVGWLARRRRPGAGRFDRRLLVAATLLLVALPAIGYGFYGDFAMRAAIPPLFALQVVVARALGRRAAPAAARAALAVLLLVAALFPLAQLRLHAAKTLARGAWVEVPARAAVEDLFAQQRGPNRHFGFVEQYVASVRRPFVSWLARRPLAPRPVPAAAPAAQGAGGSSAQPAAAASSTVTRSN